MGAKKIIIGTAANEDFLSKLPKDRVLVAIDTKDGKVATHGWTRTTEATPLDFVRRFNNLCSGFLYTIVEKRRDDGRHRHRSNKRNKKRHNKRTCSLQGGISTVEEIVQLQKMNVSTQLGMCIYTGKVSLEEAFVKCLDFEKKIRLSSDNSSGLRHKTGVDSCLFFAGISSSGVKNRERNLF